MCPNKDCWFRDTSKGLLPNNKGKKGKGKGKSKGKNSVSEVTTSAESTVTPSGGTYTSQISRVTQDDTWDRPVPVDEDEDEEYKAGYVLAAVRHRETFHQSKDWYVVHVFVDNCADEHVCSRRDFEWLAVEPSRNPNLVSASGHKLKHNGQQAVPMRLRAGRKVWITFQVCDVNGPIMSVGKFCTKGNDRCATFTTSGGTLWLERSQSTECETTTSWNAGSNLETCWHQCRLAAPVEALENLKDIMLQFHNEPMTRFR